MGWIESPRKSSKELVQAVKDLREKLGDTQESFAMKLGLSKRAIANYEKDRRPTAAVLARLAKAASDAGMGEQTVTFMQELGRDLELREIKGGTMSVDLSGENPRGYLLVNIDGKEARAFARAFYETFLRYQCGDPQTKVIAEGLLNVFSSEATKTWRNK